VNKINSELCPVVRFGIINGTIKVLE